jgi:hypothetical protein
MSVGSLRMMMVGEEEEEEEGEEVRGWGDGRRKM